MMISLRRLIDSHLSADVPAVPEPVVVDPPASDTALLALRAMLVAMGACSERATPSLGNRLRSKLTEISDSLGRAQTKDVLIDATERVKTELANWADSIVQYENENESEIKQIMSVVAGAAQAMATKDEKYSAEIGGLTGKIESIAGIDDIAAIRKSVLDTATLLKSCCEKMVSDGSTLTDSLTLEVDEYRKRLEVADRAAALDRLTGLGSRRSFDKRLEATMRAAKNFSLILLDLDDFKSTNDRYGHLAGDDLLRQFSTELLGQLAPAETAYRWGGDEFTLLVPGGAKQATELVDRIKRWVLGNYKINSGNETIKRIVQASCGVVQWNRKETSLELVARADQELYREKSAGSQVTRQIGPGSDH